MPPHGIMEHVSGKVMALLGIVGVATLGYLVQMATPRRVPSDVHEPKSSVSIRSPRRVEIDDDAAGGHHQAGQTRVEAGP
jgi:hypothetical protein